MKKFLCIVAIVLSLGGVAAGGLSISGILTPIHDCGTVFKRSKVYKVKPSSTNNSKMYRYELNDFEYYKSLHNQSSEKYPAYVLKQDSLSMFDNAYELCRELDLSKDSIDYLVTDDAHETLSAHILYFLSDVNTFSHYHRLVSRDIEYSETDTIAPDLEVYGKDGTIFSFIFNDDYTGIVSMEIYNENPNDRIAFLLKDYYLTHKLSFNGIKDAGYIINGSKNKASFNEFLLDRNKYLLGKVDHNVYNNKIFYSKDINDNITIVDSLPKFHVMFIKGGTDYSKNPHASVLNKIEFQD